MRLKHFLVESQEESFIKRAVIFTARLGKDQYTNTVSRFIKLFEKENIKCFIAYTDDSYLIKDNRYYENI